ncbi:hypothetical protein C1Y63_07740 [Corynebacterium sp. 13CS0277]|nr:hypothetical protein C1Y63_07740 [Corynebacterium sp. 13CS0277]
MPAHLAAAFSRPVWPLALGVAFMAGFFLLSPHGGLHLAVRQVIDTGVYWGGAREFVTGGDLYGTSIATVGTTLPFTYPPFAALCFAPLLLLSQFFAGVAFTVANLGWLWLIARMLTPTASTATTAWLWCAALLADPVLNTFGYGQINLVLMALVLADVTRGVGLPGWLAGAVSRLPRGVLIGVAAAIKLTPAIFVLFFLLRRDTRGILGMLAGGAGATLLAAVLRPATSWEYFRHILTDPNRIGDAGYALNVSARALVVRPQLGGSAEFAAWAALVGATGVLCLLAGWRVREDALACVTAVALLGLVASPVSWAHHWVWLLAVAVTCARRAPWLSLWVAVATIVAPIHAKLPRGEGVEYTWGLLAQLGAAQYLAIAVATWLVFLTRPTVRAPLASAPTGDVP